MAAPDALAGHETPTGRGESMRRQTAAYRQALPGAGPAPTSHFSGAPPTLMHYNGARSRS